MTATMGPESTRIKTGFMKRETYTFKRRPYRHQVAALKTLLHVGWGGALLMQPRTGKTKVAIDYASILHQKGRVNRVLIVCPVSGLDVWVKEIEENCPFEHRTVVWDKDGRKEVALPKWGRDILDFVIINYDAFSTPGVQTMSKDGKLKRRRRGGRYETRDRLRAWQPQLMVLDESHRIKTPSAQKTRMIASVAWEMKNGKAVKALVPYRVILTGTVLTKKKRIFDIYSQWKNFLNPNSPLVKGMTLAEFKSEYAVWTNRHGFPQWLRNKPAAMKRLRRLMHEESFAISRDECYDLPPRQEARIVPVKLTGHTAEVYDEMAEEMVAKLKSGEITQASIKLVQSLRLGQITSGITKTDPTPQYPEGRLVRIGNDKLKALEDILSDLFEAEEKVVIAARWRADITAIAKLCEKLKAPSWRIVGGQKRSERTAGIAEFNRHDGPGAMIVQPAAGSEAIDLRTASIFIWYSLTNSWVNFTQVEDRIALSDRSTAYYYLLAEGTVDELMYETLQEDGNLAKTITESPDRLLRNFKG